MANNITRATEGRRIFAAPPANARPHQHVFTAEGIIWRVYEVPATGQAFTSQTLSYPVDPAHWD